MLDHDFIHSFIQQRLWCAHCVPGTTIETRDGAEWEELANRAPGRPSHGRARCYEERKAVIEDTRRASLRRCGREVISAPRPKG